MRAGATILAAMSDSHSPDVPRKRASLPILDDSEARAQKLQDRKDGVAYQAAQQALEAGQPNEALALLQPLSEDPTTPLRANATLLFAGVLLMEGKARDVVEVLGHVPELPSSTARACACLGARETGAQLRRHVVTSTRAC